jgi:hypothetical protein
LTAGGPAAAAPAPLVLHLAPDAFAEGGAFDQLQIGRCRVVLADGEGRSVLQVSPAMAKRGFRDLAFTFPPYLQRYDLGLGTAAVRVRIPGSDPRDATTTLQSTSVRLRIAGTHLLLEVRFEGAGPEFVGEYSLDGPLTGAVPWQHLLDVQADDLVVTADFPLEARDLIPAIGEVTAKADFSFSVTMSGDAGLAVEDDAIRQYVADAARRELQGLFNAPAFRGTLAAAVGAVLLGDPRVAGLPVRRLDLAAAGDGGLDVRVLTTDDPDPPPAGR